MGLGPNWYQIEIDHVIYKKLASFMQKKDRYVNRFESVILCM